MFVVRATACLGLLLLAGSGPALAQEAGTAGAMLLRGAEECLRNYRTTMDIADALKYAGFGVTETDVGTFEVGGPGVWGIVVPAESYCTFQSTDIPLAQTQEAIRALADALFPGKVEDGHPERGLASPCDGISIFAPHSLIWIHYAQAGNSGECVDDGTSAIIMNM